jgi:hypothetical protein
VEFNINNAHLQNVEKVEVAYSKEEANELIKKGWLLLAVGAGQEQTGQHDYMPTFAYCLGKVRK